MPRARVLPLLAGLGLLALFGCKKNTDPTPITPPPGMVPPMPMPVGQFDTESGPHAAGKKVFVASGCFRCHTINNVRGPVGPGMPGAGGPMPPMPPMPPGFPGRPGRGPDLGKVGADETHTVEWLQEYIRDPRQKKPDSKMPPVGKKIKDADLRALAEYLASLK